MALFATPHPVTTGIDISSTAFWAQPFAERERSFARLRAEAPVSWHPPLEFVFPHDQQGFWAVTKAADITAISRQPELFQSRYGTTLMPVSAEESAAASFFLAMDAPEHSRYRGLISAAFTPKAIGKIAEKIEANARSIVDGLIGAGDIDFVQDCSAKLPMETVSDIVGVPDSEREHVAEAADAFVGGGKVAGLGPLEAREVVMEEFLYLYALGAELAAHRRENPGDDLLTNIVQAEIDGHRLTDNDVGAFLVLMAVAGNDTTKQTTTWTMLALQEHAEQRAWLMEDLNGRIMPSIEEFVRYATPVLQFTRTAAEDTVFQGAEIAAGDKVGIFFCSGNRDEDVFDRPNEFDLRRPKSPHVGFGGGGPHFCLGNGVAKTQLRAIVTQLLTRVPNIEFGQPVQLQSDFINGITSLPAHVG